MEKEKYEKEKIVAIEKFTKEWLNDLKLEVGQTGEDYLKNVLTAALFANVYTRTIDEKTIEHFEQAPTFFDWLFQRKYKLTFKIKAKRLLLKNSNEIDIFDVIKKRL